MTSEITDTAGPGWAERLSPGTNLAAILVTGLVLVFSIGVVTGMMAAWIENGSAPKLAAILAIIAALALVGALGTLLWRLTRRWRVPSGSAFDRRYLRMWVVLIAVGILTGILLGTFDDSGGGSALSLLGNDAIAPSLAIGSAALLLGVLVLSAVYYHRTIDDHEERAYLWASTLAFYFIAAAMPVAWLLARGGIIDAVGTGTAMLILLASIIFQCIAWAWFKFR